MFFGNRRTQRTIAGRRPKIGSRPRFESLEDRTLLSIDLGVSTPTANPLIATAPYGIGFAGGTTLPGTTNTTVSQGGAGWSVSDVGNVTGTGYDSFVVGAPTVSTFSTIGSGANSAAYLIFGSQSVGISTITDWIGKTPSGAYQYTADNRVGDLSQLGTTPQSNPISGATNLPFPFAGVAFTTTASSQLGASVSSVKLGNTYGILLGAPGANDVNNANPGTGRAYLITGNFANFVGKTVNLDNPSQYSGLTIYTFVNNAASGNLGYSVSGGFNIFGDGNSDVILGAPNASYGATTGTGVVYALSTALLSGSTSTINVSTIGQTGTQSAIFTGASSGSQAGWSVADGGDVNGGTSGGNNVDDLLIGAPAQNGSGAAFLIYGGSNLANLAQTVTVNGTNVRYINLANVGAASTTTGAVPGATIVGPSGSRTGFSVSSGGDFNADGFGDILIGSPNYSSSSTTTNQGLASLFYGAPSSSGSYLSGVFNLATPPSAISPLYLQGALAGSLAGYSVSQVGFINASQPSSILVGSPGYNNNSGTAYLIPGRSGGLTGSQSLLNAESAPISGVQFLLSTPNSPTTSPSFFGASVSSRFQTTSFTADGDSRQDFIIGAPGYDGTQNAARNLAGGAMIVQGGLINVPIPAANQITVPITVGAPLTSATINATTPANLQIYVYGTTSNGVTFQPTTDINVKTVKVNGIAFPNASLTADTNKANWVGGIQDAIITISPRSSLGLQAGSRTITLTGNTTTTSPFTGEAFTGSATVTVTGSSGGGGGGGGGGGLVATAAGGPVLQTTYVTHFGPSQYVPTIAALSTYNYAPIPLSVALAQYRPSLPFADRIYNFNHPTKHLKNYLGIRDSYTAPTGQAAGIFMAGRQGKFTVHLFVDNQINDRALFHVGKSYSWTHHVPKSHDAGVYTGVVPIQLTRESISNVPGVKANGTRQIGHTPTHSPSFNTNSLRRGGGSPSGA